MKLHAPGMKRVLASMQGRDGCWEWPMCRNDKGYGITRLNGKPEIASRVAYQLAFGPIPPGMNVLHQCDNPPCVRPDHLFIGTQKDNYQDAKQKDRHSRGIRHGRTVLTEVDVREIRKSTKTQRGLADQYGLGQSTIHAIKQRKTWMHVED